MQPQKQKNTSPAHERARQVGHDKKKVERKQDPPPKKMQSQKQKKLHLPMRGARQVGQAVT